MEQAFETANQEFVGSLSDLEEGSQEYQRKRRANVELTVDYMLAQTGGKREEVIEGTLEQIYDRVDNLVSFHESVEDERGQGIPYLDAMMAASTDHQVEVEIE